ncbi:MAG: hydrogenase 4 subunit B [Halomonadaceae bacterium]|nr:MAG: hydrogenase 4 subunit B [Halomonadaceae bacterium]
MWLIALLLLSPLVALLGWRRSLPGSLVVLLAVAQLLLALGLWRLLALQGPMHWELFPQAGLPGLSLRFDGLALLFVLLSSLIGAFSALQSLLYFKGLPVVQHRLWPRFWLLLPGLHLVWLAGDLITLYIAMEWVAVCVTGLIALGGQEPSLRAAMRYMQAVLLGTLAFLLGAVLLYGHYGTVVLAELTSQMSPGVVPLLALALISAGLVYRAALFPLHAWLPPAHGSSYAPLSALLSALVTKVSFYSLARLWLDWGETLNTVALAQALGVLGALAILWGGWMACRQDKLKMLVAYSSVNQVGYFFLLFPLLLSGSPEAAALGRDGAMLQVISHALAKAALFMAAGNLVLAAGSDRMAGLAGITRLLPLSLFSFGLAGVSLMGLPPSGGFMAKWALLQASLISGQWWWGLVLLAGGLLSAGYIFRVFRLSFEERQASHRFHPQPLLAEWLPLVLALMAAGLGLLVRVPLDIMTLGTDAMGVVP